MTDFYTSSTANFLYFLAAGSVIVHYILKFDKRNRQKLNKVLMQAQDVQPLFVKKAAEMHSLKNGIKPDNQPTGNSGN